MHYDFANIEVRPFLKLSDVNSPYIFGETKHVINMCDYREPEVIDLIHSKGATYIHLQNNNFDQDEIHR